MLDALFQSLPWSIGVFAVATLAIMTPDTVEDLLEQHDGFRVRLLLDASRYDPRRFRPPPPPPGAVACGRRPLRTIVGLSMVALRAAARSQAPAPVRGRSLTRAVALLVFSGLVHVATLGAALGVWSASRSSATPTAGVVFVDLAPATRAAATEARLMDGPASDDPTVAALNRQVAQLSAENTALSSSLLDERQRTAQLEAEYRRELSASETARSRLGDELAAVVVDREALASELTAAREQAAALEQELAARAQAERAALDEVKATYERLVSSLQGEIAARDVALEQANSRVTVAIADRVLFPSGQATLTPTGERVIDKVGSALTGVTDRRVLIEGHTDNVPIGPDLRSRFPTNWELSTARATEVVKRLIEHAHLPPDRLQPAGRADTDPVTSNDTEDGRRRNRRIEIILLPPASTPDSRAGS